MNIRSPKIRSLLAHSGVLWIHWCVVNCIYTFRTLAWSYHLVHQNLHNFEGHQSFIALSLYNHYVYDSEGHLSKGPWGYYIYTFESIIRKLKLEKILRNTFFKNTSQKKHHILYKDSLLDRWCQYEHKGGLTSLKAYGFDISYNDRFCMCYVCHRMLKNQILSNRFFAIFWKYSARLGEKKICTNIFSLIWIIFFVS